jgi:hypothetical protein
MSARYFTSRALWVLACALTAACGNEPAANPSDGSADEPDTGRDVDLPDDADTDIDAPSDGSAGPRVCDPDTTECVGRTRQRTCSPDGTAWLEAEPCGPRQVCLRLACEDAEPCTPGTAVCSDGSTLAVCQDDGLTRLPESCTGRSVCVDGDCVLPGCDPTSKGYVGCEFIVTDLPQDPSAEGPPVYVTLSNPNDVVVDVELFSFQSRRGFEATIEPGEIRSFSLNGIQLSGSGLTSNSARVVTSAPVTAHQFNPQNNSSQVFSNDASLLLPTAAAGTSYAMLGWPTTARDGSVPSHQTMTVVASQPNTQVQVIATADIVAGEGVEPIEAGTTATFTLQQGEALNLLADARGSGDLTGSVVLSNVPVAVFSAHQCANVPDQTAYCDHLEQQLYPLDAWGTEYVLSKFQPRGTEPDFYRVLAGAEPLTLQTNPPLPDVHDRALEPGELFEFSTTADFVLRADAPFSIAQFMVGSAFPADGSNRTCEGDADCAIPRAEACEGVSGIGDPAMLLAVPASALLDEYIVLTPADYAADYLNVWYPHPNALTMDGEALDLSAATPIGDSDWRLLRLPVEPGPHTLSSDARFGITAYGYDCDVSYAYPGGLTLEVGR